MLKNEKPANRNEHQNRKTEVFWHKNRKTDLKNSQNRKTENPNVPLNKATYHRILWQFCRENNYWTGSLLQVEPRSLSVYCYTSHLKIEQYTDFYTEFAAVSKVHDLITCESSSRCFPRELVSFGTWHVRLQSENVFELGGITIY